MSFKKYLTQANESWQLGPIYLQTTIFEISHKNHFHYLNRKWVFKWGFSDWILTFLKVFLPLLINLSKYQPWLCQTWIQTPWLWHIVLARIRVLRQKKYIEERFIKKHKLVNTNKGKIHSSGKPENSLYLNPVLQKLPKFQIRSCFILLKFLFFLLALKSMLIINKKGQFSNKHSRP